MESKRQKVITTEVGFISSNHISRSNLTPRSTRREKGCISKTSSPCRIKICDGVHSNGNKEITAIAIEDFLMLNCTVLGNGYEDLHSSSMREHLEKEFPDWGWKKNSSQRPFDIYSIEARVAIENKNSNVKLLHDGGTYSKNRYILTNATIYPNEVKVRDVVPCKFHEYYINLYGSDILDEFMDVLVVFVDREQKTNKLIRYRIVDGSYWGFEYKDFKGCHRLFDTLNDSDVRRKIIRILSERDPENTFIPKLKDEDDNLKFLLRKLISCKNPTFDEV